VLDHWEAEPVARTLIGPEAPGEHRPVAAVDHDSPGTHVACFPQSVDIPCFSALSDSRSPSFLPLPGKSICVKNSGSYADKNREWRETGAGQAPPLFAASRPVEHEKCSEAIGNVGFFLSIVKLPEKGRGQ
jgi:hypothetical protein